MTLAKRKADEMIKTPEGIVEENFKGLSDFIKDKGVLDWYKALIANCMESYHSQFRPTDEEINKLTKDKGQFHSEEWESGYFSGLGELRDKIFKTKEG